MDWQRLKAETRCWTGPSVRPEHEGVETPAIGRSDGTSEASGVISEVSAASEQTALQVRRPVTVAGTSCI